MPEGYGIIIGLKGAYLPSDHIGPFDTKERAMEALKEERERDLDEWHTYKKEEGVEKPSKIKKQGDTAFYTVPRGGRAIAMKVEMVPLDEEQYRNWEESTGWL